MGISQAAIRYLLTIYELSDDGAAVRSVDISRRLEVTPASVVHMLGVLSAEGLAEKRYYGKVRLTERGIREANRLYTACALLKAYLPNIWRWTARRPGPTPSTACAACRSAVWPKSRGRSWRSGAAPPEYPQRAPAGARPAGARSMRLALDAFCL